MKKNNWKGKNGPLLIAEIGGNHEGNFIYAKKLVRLAIKTGVDVVKLQIYEGNKLVSSKESKKRNAHFKKFELSKKQHIYLAKLCKRSGVKYLSSVWDIKNLKWIDKYLKFYKIGSGDLTAFPIIKELAKKGKPIIVSTGLSTINEVCQTVKFIQKQNPIYKNKNYLSLLQCTSTYPTLDKEINLETIKNLKDATKLTVGYSDHSLGDLALKIAYANGAEILEFHFTDSRKGKIFRDHKISLNYKETKKLIEDIKRISMFKGHYFKKPTFGEIKSGNIKSFRRGIYYKKDLKKGEKIKKNFLTFLRPNHGIDVRNYQKIIGKKVSANIEAFKKLKLKNL